MTCSDQSMTPRNNWTRNTVWVGCRAFKCGRRCKKVVFTRIDSNLKRCDKVKYLWDIAEGINKSAITKKGIPVFLLINNNSSNNINVIHKILLFKITRGYVVVLSGKQLSLCTP